MDLERSPLGVAEQSREIIKAALRRGSPVADALRIAGVPRRTWRTWVRIGEDELARCIAQDCDPEPHLAPYVEFITDVEQARSEGVNVLLDRVWQASNDPKHWRAATWLLAVQDPGHFATRVGVIDAAQDAPAVSPVETDSVVNLLEQRLAQITARRQAVIEATAVLVEPGTEAAAEGAS